jgi:hypothetical protein
VPGGDSLTRRRFRHPQAIPFCKLGLCKSPVLRPRLPAWISHHTFGTSNAISTKGLEIRRSRLVGHPSGTPLAIAYNWRVADGSPDKRSWEEGS